MPENKPLSIISWNVNGIRAWEKKDGFSWLRAVQPDIFCVQETKAQPNQLTQKFLQPEGYKVFWSSAEKKGYSGVAVYTKTDPLNVSFLGTENFDKEGRTLILDYESFTLINAYFPNSQAEGARLSYKIDFCNAVMEKCMEIISHGRDVVICGDFNIAHKPIDLKNPKQNEKNPGYLPEEREWMTRFLNSGFLDTFRIFTEEGGHYTWWSYRFNARVKDIGWRIDYFCINDSSSLKIKSSDILKDIMGSDHCPVRLILGNNK